MVPPKEIEPPLKTLVLTVKGAVLFRVVATEEAVVKELAAIVVTAVPIEREPLPAPMLKAPSRVPAPTFSERVTPPVPFAVRVSA